MLSSASHGIPRDLSHPPIDTDRLLRAEVTEALAATGYGSLRLIDATVRAGTVYLAGKVESWYLKQVAQEVVMRITGRGRVQNELAVVTGRAI